jgi:hypothetical protein
MVETVSYVSVVIFAILLVYAASQCKDPME